MALQAIVLRIALLPTRGARLLAEKRAGQGVLSWRIPVLGVDALRGCRNLRSGSSAAIESGSP